MKEVKGKFELSDKAVNQALYRLKLKKRIAQIRKGFYAILSAEYVKQGMVEPFLYIDDLMKALGNRYYVGSLSAAALQGAAHQQPMEYFVITEKPALRSIKNNKVKIISIITFSNSCSKNSKLPPVSLGEDLTNGPWQLISATNYNSSGKVDSTYIGTLADSLISLCKYDSNL